MNLTSVKYQDSCIYISLKCPRNGLDGREVETFLRKFRNIYVVYKIKAFDRQVRNTILIKRKDLSVSGNDITLKFELSHLHCPEDSQIEIGTLKLNFHEEKSEVLYINETYSFREIRSIAPVAPGKKKIVKNNNNSTQNKTVYVVEERYFNRCKDPKPSLTVIEETTPISTVMSEVESEIESKMDLETKKLDMDIRQLCYGTIDLLLSNLPLPEFNNERSPSNAMVRSIHRYINADLLRQKESEEKGVESA